MKKTIFIDMVRPGVAQTLLALLCLLSFSNAAAQTVQSEQYYFNTCKGQHVVVRESVAGVPVMSYRRTDGSCFVYGDISLNAARQITIPDTGTVGGNVISYWINDMRVVGNMCYFCGVREYTYRELDPVTGGLVVDSVGVLGRFPLDPSGTFPSPLTYNIKLVRETKCLNRMATYVYGMDTVIAMVGVVANPASQSCLTVARITFLHPWEYHVRYTNSTPREVFTDIAVDSAMMTVASYHRDAGGKNYFCLRFSKNESVQMHDNYSEFNTLYKYYTNLFGTCNSIVRPDYADVRLGAVPWTRKVYAGFACSVFSCQEVPCQTALCEINTEDKQMNSAQVVLNMYKDAHTLVDMKYLYRTFRDETDAQVALLHLTEDLYNTVVEDPYALTSSYGSDLRTLVQSHVESQMHSISAFNNSVNDIRFGGVWKPSLMNLTYMREELSAMHGSDLCMQNREAYVMTYGSKTPESENQALPSLFDGMRVLGWATKSVSSTLVDATNVCRY